MGITEEEGEDCVSRVHQVLNAHFGISDHVIENAHHVGKARHDHPRQVIARFHSRAIHRDVMMGAWDKLKNTNFRITRFKIQEFYWHNSDRCKFHQRNTRKTIQTCIQLTQQQKKT